MATTFIWPFIILQCVTVVVIVLFLRMFLHRQLEIGMGRIKRMDKENLEKEVELNDRLEKLNEEYDMKIQNAEKQADSLINMAKETAKKMRDSERVKAKEEAKRIIASALQEKEKVLSEATRMVNSKAVDFSILILERVFSEDELSGLRRRVTKEVTGVLFGSDNVGELIRKNKDIEVVTADKLTAPDRKYILKMIEKQAKGKVNVKFVVDKSILGGLILKIGGSMIDGGIAYRVNKAVLELREEI